MSLTSGARSGKNNIRRTARPPPGKHFADADIPASDAGKGGGLSRSHFKEALSALFRGACFQTESAQARQQVNDFPLFCSGPTGVAFCS